MLGYGSPGSLSFQKRQSSPPRAGGGLSIDRYRQVIREGADGKAILLQDPVQIAHCTPLVFDQIKNGVKALLHSRSSAMNLTSGKSDAAVRVDQRRNDFSILTRKSLFIARDEFGGIYDTYSNRIVADLPCASSPSTLANSSTIGADFLIESRSSFTILVRRWNMSTVRPGNDFPAPPVGSS